MDSYGFLQKQVVFEYLKTQTNLSLNPLIIGFERCKSTKGTIGPIQRNRYIFQYVIEGKGSLKLRGKTYDIGKDTLMFLPIEEITYMPDPNGSAAGQTDTKTHKGGWSQCPRDAPCD